MIRLNLQLFAKSGSGAGGGGGGSGTGGGGGRGKSYASSKYRGSAGGHGNMNPAMPKENPSSRYRGKGEIVAAVNKSEVYEIYTTSGQYVRDRTGAELLERATYNKNREGWISKKTGTKYIVRRKRK